MVWDPPSAACRKAFEVSVTPPPCLSGVVDGRPVFASRTGDGHPRRQDEGGASVSLKTPFSRIPYLLGTYSKEGRKGPPPPVWTSGLARGRSRTSHLPPRVRVVTSARDAPIFVAGEAAGGSDAPRAPEEQIF